MARYVCIFVPVRAGGPSKRRMQSPSSQLVNLPCWGLNTCLISRLSTAARHVWVTCIAASVFRACGSSAITFSPLRYTLVVLLWLVSRPVFRYAKGSGMMGMM